MYTFDFPVVSIIENSTVLCDGKFLKVPYEYRKKTIDKTLLAFYSDILSQSPKNDIIINLDPLGFTFVAFKDICYVGLITKLNNKDSLSKKMKKRYPDNYFPTQYLKERIKEEDNFRNYEDYIPKDLATQNIHEIRGLNAKISSHVDNLINASKEDEWERAFERADENVKRIYVASRLIRFILDKTRLFNVDYIKDLKIDKSKSFSIHKAVNKIVKIYKNNFKQSKSDITFEGSCSRFLAGEKEVFEILLMLLMDNALKYSRDSSSIPPQVKIEENGTTVIVSISSYGTIIPTEERETIFNRGYRSSIVTQVQGMGMGLYNASQLAKKFDAKLIYHSSPSDSSTQPGWNTFQISCDSILIKGT